MRENAASGTASGAALTACAVLIYVVGLVVGWLETIGGETIDDKATSEGVDWILVLTVSGTIAAVISAVEVIAGAIY